MSRFRRQTNDTGIASDLAQVEKEIGFGKEHNRLRLAGRCLRFEDARKEAKAMNETNNDNDDESSMMRKRIVRSSTTKMNRQIEVRRNIIKIDELKLAANGGDNLINTSQLAPKQPPEDEEEEESPPVASEAEAAAAVPRLVSMSKDDEDVKTKERKKRRSCQPIITTLSSTMYNQEASISSSSCTSQLKANNSLINNWPPIKNNQLVKTTTTRSFMNRMLICSSLIICCCLISLAIGQQQQQQQRFEVQPELQYLVQNGQEVRLRCLVRQRQGECSWLRNGRVIGSIAKKYAFSRQPEDGDCSLVIRNVSVQQDDGQWQCQVTPSDVGQETLQSRESQLVVLVPPERPQIENATSNTHNKVVVFEENKLAIVLCEVKGGNPAPQIEWILDGKNMTKEASQSSTFLGQLQATQAQSHRITQSRLRLGDIKRTMNGKNLTCVGVHQTGSQSSSVELDVQYLPSVSVPQREYSIVEGSPLSITCQVDANPPPNEVSWRLSNDASGKSQQQIRQGALLNFERTGRELNQNTFQCLAQNHHGISSPADVKLNVLYPPTALNASASESVLVGSEAQLACLFEGNPRPEIRWLFMDSLSRSPSPVLLDNPDKKQPQFLTIENVSYRNEGDYHCEARNQINGQEFYMRSSNIILDVYGEPQFLLKSPSVTKAVQGTKSDISLTFCSDPAPNKVFWQFGSMRLDVRLNNINNGQQQLPPLMVMPVAHPGGSLANTRTTAHNHMYQRFQAHPLLPLQARNSSSSLAPTCFEAKLTILDPELTDQRDFTLMVANERGVQTGTIKLRVTTPLSPMLMISSAFVTICVLFLLSLVVIFLLKRRHGSTTVGGNLQNGTNGSQQSGEKGAGSIEHLVNNGSSGGNHIGSNGNTNGLLQHAQTRGVVNGSGNGLANGASNPGAGTNGLLVAEEAAKLHHNLMSMASSDTSGDQKQLLTNLSSDRNSPVSGSTNNTNTCVDFTHVTHSSASVGGHSSSNQSTPSPLNHISVEHEFHHHHHDHDDHNDSTYQPGESVTNGAELSPHSQLGHRSGSALIYANLEYSEQHPSIVAVSSNNNNTQQQQQHSPPIYSRAPSQQRMRQQVPADFSPLNHSPTGSTSTNDSRIHSSIRRSTANRDSLSRNSNNNNNNPQPSPQGRPSVGATIAMMNSLAAAAAANPNTPTSMSSPSTGVLNGAIQQQLANSKQIRKPGPPKPPKPSIQQRSRFYQQQQQQLGGGEAKNNGLVMIGSPLNQRPTGNENQTPPTSHADQLAVEYSRIAFPARAEL